MSRSSFESTAIGIAVKPIPFHVSVKIINFINQKTISFPFGVMNIFSGNLICDTKTAGKKTTVYCPVETLNGLKVEFTVPHFGTSKKSGI